MSTSAPDDRTRVANGGSPSPRGVAKAVWSLVTPDWFEAPKPVARGLRYRQHRTRGIQPLADIYMPPGATQAPTVLIVHGGGFLIGSRNMKPVRFLTSQLLAAGLGACLIDYRMIFQGGRLDEQLADVRDAIQWWIESAASFGGDPASVTLLGISAGGALVTMAAGQLGAEAPLHGQISVFGLYEFTYLNGAMARVLPRWLLRTRDRSIWRARSPLHQALHPAPALLIHGTEDQLVPVVQVDWLQERRSTLGLHTETLVLDGEPHAFLNWPGPAADQATQQIIEFSTKMPAISR